ncbi:MFS general substrate transporter [Flagelloscypha sp. PMI_526]|nr:MFS general substrate transporter [Flagelloscypha sp. PMI_526]
MSSKVDVVTSPEIEQAAVSVAGPPSSSLTRKESSAPDRIRTKSDPYSLLTRGSKYGVVFLVSVAGLFSPLSANIYLPAIPTIATEFHQSIELINLSVTVYMVLQGVSPMVFGTLGDYWGRRPLFILCLMILAASCVGLALIPTSSYALLMVLRCIQASGSASTIALGAGVVGDISTPEERGGLFGLYNSAPLLAPALAPVIGAALTQHLSWRAIFWFLTIGSTISALSIAIFLPETLRSIVGNGSIRPRLLLHRPLVDVFWKPTLDASSTNLGPRKKFRNPFTLFLEPDVDLLLFVSGITYAVLYGVTTSIAALFQNVYPFLNVTNIGLCYLPVGGGMIVGSMSKKKFPSGHSRRGKDPDFPLEKARLRLQQPMLVVLIGATLGFGWSLQKEANLAVPLILLLIIGFTSISFMTITATVLIDLAPEHSGSITACNNIVRCALGAACVAAIDPMFKSMGVGFAYVVLGGLCALMIPLSLLTIKIGPLCRVKRQKRVAAAA